MESNQQPPAATPIDRASEILQKLSAHLNTAVINAMLTQEEIGQVQVIWENTNLSYIEAFSIFLLEGHGYITLPNKDFEDDWDGIDEDEDFMNMQPFEDEYDPTEEEILKGLEEEWNDESNH